MRREICGMMVLGLGLFSSFAQAALPITGPVVSPVNGHSYYLLSQSNWTDAEAAAVVLGGHLATSRNAAENSWIAQTFENFSGVRRQLWIGLNDQVIEGTFVWASGEPVTFTNWMSGEPSDFADDGTGEDFVHIGNFVGWQPYDFWNDNRSRIDQVLNDNSGLIMPFNGVAEVVPEPGVFTSLLGAIALVGSRRTRRRRAS
jgi:hypothetical protein